LIGVFFSLLQFIAIVNAFLRSWRERFVLGTIGAVLRALLSIAGAVGAVWERLVRFPGSDVPAPLGASVIVLLAAALGPLLSFVVLWSAHRRRKDAPMLEEERLSRPFNAWLPVALFDVAFVAINGFAYLISKPF